MTVRLHSQVPFIPGKQRAVAIDAVRNMPGV